MALTTAQLPICNDALALLSDIQIDSDTTSKQYVVCNQFYDTAKEEVFAEHSWNELITMGEILEDEYPPLFSFSHRYALPSDCVRVISIGNDTGTYDSQSDSFYRVEDGYIYTNYGITPATWSSDVKYPVGKYIVYNGTIYVCIREHGPDDLVTPVNITYWTESGEDLTLLRLRYISNDVDESKFSKTLRACIVHALAIKIVARITGDSAQRSALVNEYEQIIVRKARTIDGSQGRVRYPWKSWLLTTRHRNR